MGITQVIMLVLALITLGTGVVLNQRDTYPEVLSEADVLSPEPTISATSSPQPTPVTTLNPTPPATTTPIAQPSNNLSDLFYPGASVVSITGNTAKLTSSANPDAIFTWYLEQFRARNLDAISSSKTNVNNNFQAKLAGADTGFTIEVSLRKNSNSNTVEMELKLN